MMLSLIPVGLISVGDLCSYKSYQVHKDIKNKFNSEKIYKYPDCIATINDIPKNSVIFVPRNNIDKTYYIGSMELNKVMYYKERHNIFGYEDNIYCVMKKYFKLKEIILFPSIYDNLCLNKNLMESGNIKVLIDNQIKLSSTNTKTLFDEYECIVKRNLPEYYSDLKYSKIFFDVEQIELTKNLINDKNNMFLIVDPSPNKKDLEIKLISDNVNNALNEKFTSNVYVISSLLTISVGIISTYIFLYK